MVRYIFVLVCFCEKRGPNEVAGACRQVLSEFGNMDVYCLSPHGKIIRTTLHDLMPMAFSKRDLDRGQGKAEEDE